LSGKRNIPNDGQALTTPDVQRIGDGAAAMDDRVYENLLTPPALGAKTITPIGLESPTYNPRLACVPGVANGTVQLQPCLMQVGSPSIALNVCLAKTLQAALATALFGANASGVTRYDLVYATVQRTVDLTGPRVIKSPTDGSESSPTVNLEDAPAVTLTILPNVGNVTPLATMPADNNGGANGEAFGSFNFPIALVALPNGYASAGAITQAMITQMWTGGWIHAHRMRGSRIPSLFSGAAAEKPSTPLTDRWGTVARAVFPVKLLAATGNTIVGGVVLDNSIDWRKRLIWGSVFYLGSALTPIESVTAPSPLVAGTPFQPFYSGSGTNVGAGTVSMVYNGGATTVGFAVDAAGNLKMVRAAGNPIDAANGDILVVIFEYSDQFTF
jgi:hypothetical protein